MENTEILQKSVDSIVQEIKSEPATLDLGEKYQFANNWDIWYHHSLNDWTVSGYRKIFSILNIKTFWDFHNNIDCIGGINNLHFFLMRKGITPIYEDTRNRNGGCFSVLVPINESYAVWEKLAAGLCGETLIKDNGILSGLSINQKSNVSVIKIWNNDRTKNDPAILPQFIRKYGNIIYQKHKLDF
jgi:hypothetical protein